MELRLEPELFIEFFEFARGETRRFMSRELNLKQKVVHHVAKNGIKKLYKQYKDIFFNPASIRLQYQNRREYIYYKAILTISDWCASGHNKPIEGFSFSPESLKQNIVDKLIEENKLINSEDFSFREFQTKSLVRHNVLAMAPTGSGKTEAALLWASRKNRQDKVIYLLPTRVTANAIYKRLQDYFSNKNVSIVHSSAFYLQKELNEASYQYIDYLRDKTFFKPFTICTIDQVLTMGFNMGYWELKSFHAINAKIIIDEIHLYSPYTLGLTVATMRYLKTEFSASFYIMSATMPSKLLDLLSGTLSTDNLKIIEDKELLNQSNNIFEVREKSVDELHTEIENEIKSGKKVMIVVNTVAEAIRLYEKYKKFHPICYHSKFINKDKTKKETMIFDNEKKGGGTVLIATQIVEVSLDIDYDILFTENAPIDAIIQRAGRINRSGEKNDTRVIVFRHRKVTKEFVYPTGNILEKTFQVLKSMNSRKLTVKELREMVNHVYEDLEIESSPDFQDGLNKYREIQEGLHFIKDNSGDDRAYTREGLDQVDIIPIKFKDEIINHTPGKKRKYEVSVRKWQYKKRKSVNDNYGFVYLDINYSFEKGIEF